MTKRITLQLAAIVSDNGTRCAAECPHLPLGAEIACHPYKRRNPFGDGSMPRTAACIAAEQAAASVPPCESARGLDASEALREARVQGMREALEIMRSVDPRGFNATPYVDAAIEAVRKGER